MNILRRLLVSVSLATASATLPAQIDAYHGVDSATHEQKTIALGNTGYRPISIAAYGTANNLRYAAVWVLRPGPNFIPFHGLDGAQYQTMLNNNPGFVPTILSIADGGSNERFAGMLELTGNSLYARHGQTPQQFADEVVAARDSDWRIKTADIYGQANDIRFAVSFEPNPDKRGWGYYTANSIVEHNDKFAGMKQGYARQTSAAFSDFNRFVSCWDDTNVGQTIQHHDMTAAQYDQLVNQYWNQNSYYPINVCASGSGNNERFSAVFAATDIPKTRQWTTTGQFVPELQTFDAWVQNWMQTNNVRGASLAVTKNGHLKMARGYTWAEPGYTPIQPTSLFRTASLAKPITSIAVHQQIEKTPGPFSYQSTMASFFGNPQMNAANAGLIDIQDLLTHEGGWDSRASAANYDPMFIDTTIVNAGNLSYPIDQTDIRNFMQGQPLEFVPGQPGVYCNYGFTLLARILEQVNPGKTFVEIANARIFDPLGLTRPAIGRSHFGDRMAGEVLYHPRLLAVRSSVNDNSRPFVALQYGGWNQENMDGNGAWVLAAPDLAKILACFELGLFNPILGPTETSNMWTLDAGANFLKGWWTNNQGTSSTLREHNGILPGTRTYCGTRADGISFVLLTNGDQALGSTQGAQLSTLADNVSIWPPHDLFPGVGIPRFKLVNDSMTTYGLPCAGSQSTPFLSGSGSSMIGSSPNLNLVAALPNTGVLSMVGTSAGSLELTQLGAPGCRLHVQPIAIDLIFSNAVGMASTSIYLPINPSLIGQHIYVQDAIYDPTVNQLGFNTSNGVDIKIGGWLGQ
ncbi:MAG: CubicO group peptidase (beta-lactamase class C family) [Planctomycetota bacterium]|jgi:CubicO group peptidase (beta-lactamase class C family)